MDESTIGRESDELIAHGCEVKALGDGRIGGYLVRFTTPKDPDLTGDFFSKDTELGVADGGSLPVFYDHGMDGQIKARKIGSSQVKYDDIGLWVEAQLEMRDEYEKMIYELAAAGKLGWSSGAAGHLVERESIGKAYHIKTWIIAEASLTPTPAEARNDVTVVKAVDVEQIETPVEETTMNEDEVKALIDATVASTIEAMKPEVKAGFADVRVTEDEADRALKGQPFKTGEFFTAVKNAALNPGDIDKRLLPLKATGLNETIPSQGGFLVSQDVANGIQEHMWGTGSVLSQFNPITVSGNGLVVNVVDESSRVAGSRGGGVLGYWLAEGGEKTGSKPKFGQLNLKLHKVAALCYATDELLEDATALDSWINAYVPNELRFMVEDAIINGDGVAKPLGILAAPALVPVSRYAASAIGAVDVAGMWARRYVGVNDYVWFVNPSVMPQLLTMTIGDQPVFLPPNAMYSGTPYGTLFGRPVIETEYNAAMGTAGDILLASPSMYSLITKGGVQSASSIHVSFKTDETAFRFVYRVDGQPSWSSAVTPFKGSATISPFVTLAATT